MNDGSPGGATNEIRTVPVRVGPAKFARYPKRAIPGPAAGGGFAMMNVAWLEVVHGHIGIVLTMTSKAPVPFVNVIDPGETE